MQVITKSYYIRLQQEVNTELTPISLRSVGHYLATENWTDKIKAEKDFVELFWGIEGEGEFCLDGKNYLLKPGYVTYYFRKEKHLIRAASKRWDYRWFTFDGPLANDLMRSFNYPRVPFYAGTCPEELFMKLEEDICGLTPYDLRKSGISVYALLVAAGGHDERNEADDLTVQRALEFIEENYANETINVNSIAYSLGVHRSTLSRKFHAKTRMAPGDYLCHVRVQKALTMLRTTNLSALEIGNLCGIPNPCYFSMVIKKITGMAPGKFRKQ